MKKLIISSALIASLNINGAPACMPTVEEYNELKTQIRHHTPYNCTCRDYDCWDNGVCRIKELKEELHHMENMFRIQKFLDEYEKVKI